MNIWLVETSTTGENNKRLGLAHRLGDAKRLSENLIKRTARKNQVSLSSIVTHRGSHRSKVRTFVSDIVQEFGVPDVIVSSGSKPSSIMVPVTAKLFIDAFWLNIGRPRRFSDLPNLILEQAWDNTENTSETRFFRANGMPHHITAEALEQERTRTQSAFAPYANYKKTLFLLGGEIAGYKSGILYDAVFYQKVLNVLRQLEGDGSRIFVSNSRRTPETFWKKLKAEHFKNNPPIFVSHDGPDVFSYAALQANADAIVVCSDSMSMLWEAAATDKPVYALLCWENREIPGSQNRSLEILLDEGRVHLIDQKNIAVGSTSKEMPLDVNAEFARAALDEIQNWLPKRRQGFSSTPRSELIKPWPA